MNKNPYKNHKKNISITSSIILSSLIMTVVIQFFIETTFYSWGRLILYILIFFGSALQLSNLKLKKNEFLLIYFILAFLALGNILLILLLNSNISLDLITQVLLSFILLILGYSINISGKEKDKTIVIYIMTSTILGLFVIFFYGDGFDIAEQYFFRSKNQVGPFIASTSLICMFSLLLNQQKYTLLSNKLFLSIIFFINSAVLLSLRNRSGIISLVICLSIYILSKNKMKLKRETFIVFPVILLIVYVILYSGIIDPIFKYIYDSLFLNYDITDINSLSANRTNTYGLVLDFVKESPFFGELSSLSGIIGTPHNYLLNLLLKYGIFGMLPLLALYFYIWIFVIKRIMIDKENNISLYLMLFMLVISLFEYTYPYSPLTTVSLTWFLFGYYLNPAHK